MRWTSWFGLFISSDIYNKPPVKTESWVKKSKRRVVVFPWWLYKAFRRKSTEQTCRQSPWPQTLTRITSHDAHWPQKTFFRISLHYKTTKHLEYGRLIFFVCLLTFGKSGKATRLNHFVHIQVNVRVNQKLIAWTEKVSKGHVLWATQSRIYVEYLGSFILRKSNFFWNLVPLISLGVNGALASSLFPDIPLIHPWPKYSLAELLALL